MSQNSVMAQQLTSSAARNQGIAKLREIVGDGGVAAQWDEAWKQDATPWDRGCIQPPLKEFIESDQGRELLARVPSTARVLVPGCGSGYDAGYFAELGFESLGLDISQTAVDVAKRWAQDNVDPAVQSKLRFEVLDFFKFAVPEGGFDLIYDYTFFTAFPPSLRAPWGDRMRELVRPGGHLIALIWPIDGARTGGPPHSVSVELMEDALSTGWEKVADFVPKTGHDDHLTRQRLAVWKRVQALL